jgi:hypothetical protein
MGVGRNFDLAAHQSDADRSDLGISRISVAGFKSLASKTDVDIRPLTVLTGANSSGKSSLMQPLLLMKQTLDSERIPPGPFWLWGELARYTEADQFLSNIGQATPESKTLKVELKIGGSEIALEFAKTPKSELAVELTRSSSNGRRWELTRHTSPSELRSILESVPARPPLSDYQLIAQPDRCFLGVGVEKANDFPPVVFHLPEVNAVRHRIQRILHVDGLRGSFEREFYLHGLPMDTTFPGDFEEYVPSIILSWQDNPNNGNGLRDLYDLGEALRTIELASGIEARKLNESQLELRVPRTLHGDPKDLINIIDAGLGVPQVLPVLVALIAATPGQLVHIEQPEQHLHPRAQWKLAQLLVDAANRGLRLVIETHSSLLLRGILTEVAENRIANDKVILHWFERDKETGVSSVRSKEPDSAGRVGDWPEDFSDVELKSDNQYLDAVEKKLFAEAK